jgi:hypothetical protein
MLVSMRSSDEDLTDEDILAEEMARAAVLLLSGELIRRGLGSGMAPSASYGVTYRNDVFSMLNEGSHERAQDEADDAEIAREGSREEPESLDEPWTEVPYFEHFPSGMTLWWYKHMNRSFKLSLPEGTVVTTVLADCLRSLPEQG